MASQRRKVRPPLPPWLAAAESVASREAVLAPYIATGSVLDLGVVDSRRAVCQTSQRIEQFATGLHDFLCRANPNVLGVDIDAEGIDLLRNRGYQVACANVETMNLGRSFDTIVAGEIIEHLPNPGIALTCLKRHLALNGRLILTTCNPFYLRQFWKILRRGDIQVHEEHTAWFDPRTLGQLLAMSGYEVERLCWLRKRPRGGWLSTWRPLRGYFHPNFLMVARPLPAHCAAA